jgi:hypothetical protein
MTATPAISLDTAAVAWGRAAVERRLAWFAADASREDTPDAEREWIASQESARGWQARIDEAETAMWSEASKLAALADLFQLDPTERKLLTLVLADALDPGLTVAWTELDRRRRWGRLTSEIAARLLGMPRGCAFAADGALFQWGLVEAVSIEPGLPSVLSLDPAILDWLCGAGRIDAVLAGVTRIQRADEPLGSWPVAETVERISRLFAAERRVRCVVRCPRGAGANVFASAVAQHFGAPLLVAECDAIAEEAWKSASLCIRRRAYLDGCVPAWQGLSRRLPRLAPAALEFLIVEPTETPAAPEGAADVVVELGVPPAAERALLWKRFIPWSDAWSEEELQALAARHRSLPAEIRRAAEALPATPADAARLLREQSVGRLGPLAERIECPFTLDDLVAGTTVRETLDDFAFEAGTRATFWEAEPARRLFPQGRGLAALFCGPPGTGKTMAAQCIAANLELDLYRINLSAIVSKWVGETSQNIERLLRAASGLDAVLFFDEADALFAKRSNEIRDAQDKFANQDASHLLTAIENYSGIAILATNMKGNIDPAFLRRIRFVVDFPKPDAAQRGELWRRMVAALDSAESARRLDADLERLATSVEATGAQIKNAVLGAVFRAAREGQPLSASHLLRGLNRELVKEGRALGAREARRLEAYA